MSARVRSVPAAPQSAALRSFEAEWRARPRDSLAPLREEAMLRFLRLGLPTMREESWRYTNLRELAARSFTAAIAATGESGAAAAAVAAPAAAAVPLRLTDDGSAHVEIANGEPGHSNLAAAQGRGFDIRSLRELALAEPDLLSPYLANPSDSELQRWALLNTALFSDGLHVRVAADATAPLLLQHTATGTGSDAAVHPRTIVSVAPGASATIIEHHAGGSAPNRLCNSVTQLELGAGARVDHYRIFSEPSDATHIDSLDVRQAMDSRCRQFTVVLGGGLVRASLGARLEGRGASLESFALLVGQGARHVDCVGIAVHAARDTRSRQTARVIAGDSSRAIFNSKVRVEAGAAHADSQQSCRGLLLSASAEIDTRPQLEIHTDEVKCAHGATTGRLDPEMFFYLLSRGLDRKTAQSLLVFAFLDDVLTGVSLPFVRAAIETALIPQLPDSQLLGNFR